MLKSIRYSSVKSCGDTAWEGRISYAQGRIQYSSLSLDEALCLSLDLSPTTSRPSFVGQFSHLMCPAFFGCFLWITTWRRLAVGNEGQRLVELLVAAPFIGPVWSMTPRRLTYTTMLCVSQHVCKYWSRGMWENSYSWLHSMAVCIIISFHMSTYCVIDCCTVVVWLILEGCPDW